MPDQHFIGTLRGRMAVAMMLLAVAGSSFFAAGIYIANEGMEQTVLTRVVQDEFRAVTRELQRDPEARAAHSALMQAYVGSNTDGLPPQLVDLPAGVYHGVHIGDQIYQVLVNRDGARPIFVTYDITGWETRETRMKLVLIAGVLIVSAGALWLGFWMSRTVIAPVTALAHRLKSLDPGQRKVRIGGDFKGAELADIADAFDRYMERLDGFVEREQAFTAAASHELRTPLAVVQGAVDVLEEQAEAAPAVRRATLRIGRATREMREFIEAMLFLSRESGPLPEAPPQPLRALCEQLLSDYREYVRNRPVKIVGALGNDFSVAAPTSLLTILISNLLRNAVENTTQGEVRLVLEGGECTVEDSGRGIRPEHLARIYERDFSTKAGGGGMGLYIVKRICERYGWHIDISSPAAGGTRVRIRFSN